MKFGPWDIQDNEIVIQTSLSFVFVNLRPFLPYHLLVCPKRIVKKLADLENNELCDLVILIQKLQKALKSLGKSWNVNLQDGKEAGQTVEHVHFHVIPRNENDLKRNDDIYEKIDESRLGRDRTSEEMAEEATFLLNLLKTSGIDF